MAKQQTGTTLTLNTDERKNKDYVVYDIPGGGLVWLPTRRIDGEPPAELIIPMVFKAAAPTRAKMTDEERKAAALARKNETPEQKADRQAQIVAKAQARLDALRAQANVRQPE